METELFDVAGLERDGQLKDMLMLQPEDIANAVLYVLGTPGNVLVTADIIFFWRDCYLFLFFCRFRILLSDPCYLIKRNILILLHVPTQKLNALND